MYPNYPWQTLLCRPYTVGRGHWLCKLTPSCYNLGTFARQHEEG